jgi:hypothetical protein
MNRWTKIGAAAAALALVAGVGITGSAFAGGDPDAQPPSTGASPDGSGDTKILGGNNNETTFVAISPCRIIDTRLAGGKLDPAAGSRVFDVAGTGATFAAQGGKAGGCSIPLNATAIEATITAVEAQSGFLRAWPANQAAPNATFLNYDDAFNVSNTGAVGINGCTGICLINTDLRLRAFGNPTHVVVDVNGYYIRQPAANVAADGSIIDSNRASDANRLFAGEYEVIFDRDVTDCVYTATPANAGTGFTAVVDPRSGNANAVYVAISNQAGTEVDSEFFVDVTC